MHSCPDCEDILHTLIWPPQTDEDLGDVVQDNRINFGALDSIIANTQCTLCRLVSRIFAQNRPDDWVQQGRIYCFINGGTPRVTSNGVRKDWAIELEFLYPDTEQETQVEYLWRPHLQLVADDVPLLDIAEDCFQLGRLHSTSAIDESFINQCLKTCLEQHGAACEISDKAFALGKVTLPAGMRLIDTQEYRIVPAPENCSYVILSYVWGTTNFLTLTKDTIEALTSKDALRRLKVPKTIAHAIEVTRMLNQQYLWVDAICILQDDLSEKISQIQKMDVIYSKAMLTIVALDSTHADGGLWGPGTKNGDHQQIVEEIGGLRFIGSAPIIDLPLEQSVWYKRAWTFQEFALSRRFLFFSDYQTYYSCESSACSEAYVDRASVTGQWRLENNESQHPVDFVGRATNHQALWPQLLRGYCRRALSFESDGLNAAAGVLQSFANGNQDGFLCGLPVSSLFENGLLWFATGPLRRRGLTFDHEPFPSWSWVGWVGNVSYESFEESQAIVECRVIHEWSVEYKDKLLHSNSLHFPHSAGQMISHLENEQWHEANASLQNIQSGVLCFESKVAAFTIDTLCWNQLYETDDQDCQYTGLYKVYHGERWVGSVHMENEAVKTMDADDPHEFIVISKSTNDVWPRQIDVRPHDPDADVVLLYDETLLENHDWHVYNVMLISCTDDIAHRQGIGQIHKESFDAAPWSNMKIRLS